MSIIFCAHPMILEVTKDLYDERAKPLRSPCTCCKFTMRGQRSKMASKKLQDTYLCLTFNLRFCVKYVSSEYNLRDLYLSSVCASLLGRGTHVARTRFTPHGTSTCLLKVSCSNFGGSVRVQSRALIKT
jgi:hypothetical protein